MFLWRPVLRDISKKGPCSCPFCVVNGSKRRERGDGLIWTEIDVICVTTLITALYVYLLHHPLLLPKDDQTDIGSISSTRNISSSILPYQGILCLLVWDPISYNITHCHSCIILTTIISRKPFHSNPFVPTSFRPIQHFHTKKNRQRQTRRLIYRITNRSWFDFIKSFFHYPQPPPSTSHGQTKRAFFLSLLSSRSLENHFNRVCRV